jgi:hypothetical protein
MYYIPNTCLLVYMHSLLDGIYPRGRLDTPKMAMDKMFLSAEDSENIFCLREKTYLPCGGV